MNERIKLINKKVMAGECWFETTPTAYSREDLFLDPVQMSAKRVYEYILNQNPKIEEYNALAGYLRFDGSVEGDIFNRPGHKHFNEIYRNFYNKPLNGLLTFEWQHSEGNFKKIIDFGIDGIKEEIAKSKESHTEKDEIIFLNGLDRVCDAIIGWANKCADVALERSKETENEEYKANLVKLSSTLRKIPQRPAETFYEAVQCIYICYPFLPDSIGLIDRQLYDFYKKDIADGTLNKEDAAAYLQELFLMLQARINIKSDRFYRGGESHFCVGGYLPDGSDGFSELTRLIIESLMELDCAIPQISLRWTEKTPTEVLKFVMDCERKDKYKRIAFVNDEVRIKAYIENADYTFEQAVNYSMVGCNEPCMTGGRILGASNQNILRCMANTFKNRAKEIENAKTFDEFYTVYEDEMFKDIKEILYYDRLFTEFMARDCNLVSSIFLDGCIEAAKSATSGGAALSTATMDIIGVVSSIDSLSVVKQFVFDEKKISMKTLIDALNNNWEGYEDLRTEILKTGNFFGNDIDSTNEVAQRFTTSIYNCLQLPENRHCYGRRFIVGNLIGYNEHHKWFGEATAATPDGRRNGEPMSYGMGQGDNKDREGITALLNSIAKADPKGIMTGPSVTNVLIDDQLMKNDEFFDMVVLMFETYFKNGGTHFQLTYVSKEDLIAAKDEPDKYKNLRVRVSGFSDFFVNLNDALQDEIILRTVKKG